MLFLDLLRFLSLGAPDLGRSLSEEELSGCEAGADEPWEEQNRLRQDPYDLSEEELSGCEAGADEPREEQNRLNQGPYDDDKDAV